MICRYFLVEEYSPEELVFWETAKLPEVRFSGKHVFLVITFVKMLEIIPNLTKSCLVAIITYLQKDFKRKIRLIIAIFSCLFILSIFANIHQGTPLLSEQKSHSHWDFALKQSCIDINSATQMRGPQQNSRNKLLNFKLKTR